MAFCQDTGYAVVFLHVGQDVHFTGGDLNAAIDRGSPRATATGTCGRPSCTAPSTGATPGDNTPAMTYHHVVPGEGVALTVLIKGAGCDNMSALRMLTPAQGSPR
jgi:fumarate hydratase subunit alpha